MYVVFPTQLNKLQENENEDLKTVGENAVVPPGVFGHLPGGGEKVFSPTCFFIFVSVVLMLFNSVGEINTNKNLIFWRYAAGSTGEKIR